MNIKNDLILSIGYCQSVFCYYTTMPGNGGIYMYGIDSCYLYCWFSKRCDKLFFKIRSILKKKK